MYEGRLTTCQLRRLALEASVEMRMEALATLDSCFNDRIDDYGPPAKVEKAIALHAYGSKMGHMFGNMH